MPRKPINYESAVVYKICCKDVNIVDIYIGSTTNFTKRKYKHRDCCCNVKRKGSGVYVYMFMREHGGWENWEMVEIEKVKCNDSNELHTRERYYFDLLKANLNKNVPTRTVEEYREHKKEFIKEKEKEYRLNNKDKIKINRDNKAKLLETFSCGCGSQVSHADKVRHNKSKKHLNFELTLFYI